MTTTNLDKFEAIEKMMDTYKELKEPYLAALKERKDYMNEYRREYRKLVRALNDIKTSLKKENATSEEISVLKKSARISLRKQLEALEEQKELDPYKDYDKAIDAVHDALSSLQRKDLKNIEDIKSDLARYEVKIKEIDALVEYASYRDSSQSEQKEKVLDLIDIAESDYLSGFKAYREACENEEGVIEMFDDIFNVLAQLGYDLEASIMADALPDLEESRKKRPSPDELLEVLKPIRSNKLLYWKSNRNKARAYYYNKDFADALRYARRALLEDREHEGTKSAFDSLEDTYNELETYMNDHYHERGGTPHNYHGHLGRKK